MCHGLKLEGCRLVSCPALCHQLPQIGLQPSARQRSSLRDAKRVVELLALLNAPALAADHSPQLSVGRGNHVPQEGVGF